MANYKTVEDLVNVKFVPADWTGYENPSVEVTIQRGADDAFHKEILKSCIGEAILKYSSLTNQPLVREIKQ